MEKKPECSKDSVNHSTLCRIVYIMDTHKTDLIVAVGHKRSEFYCSMVLSTEQQVCISSTSSFKCVQTLGEILNMNLWSDLVICHFLVTRHLVRFQIKLQILDFLKNHSSLKSKFVF